MTIYDSSTAAADRFLLHFGRVSDLDLPIPPSAAPGAGTPQMILFDPDAEPGTRGETEIVAALLGAAEGKADVLHYSIPWLRSLTPPTQALRALFPNLKPAKTRTTRVIGPQALADMVGGRDGALRLRIEDPAFCGDILDTIHAAGLLDRVEAMSIRAQATSFFEATPDAAALVRWLGSHGLSVEIDDQDDADWCELRVSVDLAARRLQTLESELSQSAAQIARMDAAAAELQAALEAMAAERDILAGQLQEAQAARAEHDAKLQAALEAMTAERDTLAGRLQEAQAAREGHDAELQAARDARAGAEASASAHLAEAEALRAGMAETAAALQALEADAAAERAASLAERDDLTARLTGTEAALQALRAEDEARRTRVTTLESEVNFLNEECRKRLVALESEAARATALEADKTELSTRLSALGERLGQLTASKEKREAQLQDQTSQIQALQQALSAAEAELSQGRTEAEAGAKERDQLDRRLALAREDLRRAEGQIAIIKDLLLRDSFL